MCVCSCADCLCEQDQKLQGYAAQIAALYPPDIVTYYSPNFADHAIKRLDELEGGITHTQMSISAPAATGSAPPPAAATGALSPAPAAAAPASAQKAKS